MLLNSLQESSVNKGGRWLEEEEKISKLSKFCMQRIERKVALWFQMSTFFQIIFVNFNLYSRYTLNKHDVWMTSFNRFDVPRRWANVLLRGCMNPMIFTNNSSGRSSREGDKQHDKSERIVPFSLVSSEDEMMSLSGELERQRADNDYQY